MILGLGPRLATAFVSDLGADLVDLGFLEDLGVFATALGLGPRLAVGFTSDLGVLVTGLSTDSGVVACILGLGPRLAGATLGFETAFGFVTLVFEANLGFFATFAFGLFFTPGLRPLFAAGAATVSMDVTGLTNSVAFH